ncbi:cation:proton antiporter [Corynebacterium lujinxingii]|uniref:Sodium:proton antiporter n=1 Tax=Corynebacterium lujinxingii TaxID=2763010 RepID=A0A7H0JYI6_9CORY|nr:sodium:proton antiporter [Corynebacterium lujinxingii]MBC3178189.1 sodium:proton antiporter [Corynebacterium lujinxingii]NNO10932.1 sodium:proton antiporter [Corynebacterium lujinxingii]QNP90102.1 sodium:proton antiporter [Corynebacterium lujinxingii]
MGTFIAIIGLLLATVFVAAIGERTGLPWPALLTIVVAPVIFIPGVDTVSIPTHLILPIFLPPLLWSLARRTSWGQIGSQLNVVVTMSVILVFLTIAALTATAMWMLPGLSLATAMVLAAAIAPPDPVAVDAVAGPAGIPKRITGTLQTEGLFNDAASIVTFNVAMAAAVAHGEVDFGKGALQFLYAAVVAVLVGLVVGRLAAVFANTVPDSVIRTAFTWVLPFAIYAGCEAIEASGVIAIVIAAVEMSSRSAMTAEDRLTGHSFWETVELLFTGVAFGLIGMSVRDAMDTAGTHIWQAVQVGVVLSLVAFAVRFAWMWVLCKMNQRKGRANVSPLRMQEVLLMAWAGMRGLVTLALVLAIPASATSYHRELSVIALTVLTCTMVIPGLLLPWLVDKLDLQNGPAGDKDIEELNQRAFDAARKAVREHGEEYAPEAYAMIQERLDSIAEQRLQDPEGSEERKAAFNRARAGAAQLQTVALRAASRELQQARRERQYNPADVDAVLADLDRLILSRERNALAAPSRIWEPER